MPHPHISRFPVPVRGQAGKQRWKTSDHRTHTTRQDAEDAQALLGVVEIAQSGLSDRQRHLLRRDDFTSEHFGSLLVAVATFLSISLAVAAWQCLAWLKTGRWPTMTLQDGLRWIGVTLPRAEWVGVQHVIDWLATSPLSLISMGFAGLLLWVALRGDNSPDLQEAKAIVAAHSRQN